MCLLSGSTSTSVSTFMGTVYNKYYLVNLSEFKYILEYLGYLSDFLDKLSKITINREISGLRSMTVFALIPILKFCEVYRGLFALRRIPVRIESGLCFWGTFSE